MNLKATSCLLLVLIALAIPFRVSGQFFRRQRTICSTETVSSVISSEGTTVTSVIQSTVTEGFSSSVYETVSFTSAETSAATVNTLSFFVTVTVEFETVTTLDVVTSESIVDSTITFTSQTVSIPPTLCTLCSGFITPTGIDGQPTLFCAQETIQSDCSFSGFNGLSTVCGLFTANSECSFVSTFTKAITYESVSQIPSFITTEVTSTDYSTTTSFSTDFFTSTTGTITSITMSFTSPIITSVIDVFETSTSTVFDQSFLTETTSSTVQITVGGELTSVCTQTTGFSQLGDGFYSSCLQFSYTTPFIVNLG